MHRIPVASLFPTLMIGLGLATGAAQAEAVKVTPQLTVFTEEQTRGEGGGPTVLRGSATRRGTVDSRGGGLYEPSQFQLGAGAKLWLTDPVTGRVIVCDERRTSRVGSRFIGCLEDQLPYAIYE